MNEVKMIFKYVDKSNVDNYISSNLDREYVQFINDDQVKECFKDYIENFYLSNSSSSIEDLRYYTGLDYKNINSVLRGIWDYEVNGELTESVKREAYNISDSISSSINNSQEIGVDIKTYRGTNLDAFRKYGVTSINDLVNLKGEYYYATSFTSTSLVRDNSFFNKELEYHNNSNIEIEYLIPSEAVDGIPLITDDLSYSKSQTEFLIDKSSLFKVIDVRVDDKVNMAYVKMMLVPKRVWNMDYSNQKTK